MTTKYFLICIFLSAIFLTKAYGQGYILLAADREKNGQYAEAAVLYERVLFEASSSDALIDSAIQGKVNCLKKTAQFSAAAGFIKSTINLVSSDSIKAKYYGQWATSCYLANQLDECLSLIELSKLNFPNYTNKQWLDFLKVLCLNEQNKWLEAKQAYKEWLVNEGLDSAFSDSVYAKVPKLKKESTATWLSTFIPGGGQLYAGKPWHAMAAVVIQGAALYYGWVNFQDKYYLSAWLIGGGLFGSFRFGDARHAEALVKQRNKKVSSAFNEAARNKLLEQMRLINKK